MIQKARTCLRFKLLSSLKFSLLDCESLCHNPQCVEDIEFRYKHSLKVTGFLSYEEVSDGEALARLFEKMDKFKYTQWFVLRDPLMPTEGEDDNAELAECTCDKEVIAKFFNKKVEKIRNYVEGEFQGLCLDCMYTSVYGDGDYWTNGSEARYDDGCSIRHGESTWYFSYMGKPADMEKFQAESQSRIQVRRRAEVIEEKRAGSFGETQPSGTLEAQLTMDPSI